MSESLAKLSSRLSGMESSLRANTTTLEINARHLAELSAARFPAAGNRTSSPPQQMQPSSPQHQPGEIIRRDGNGSGTTSETPVAQAGSTDLLRRLKRGYLLQYEDDEDEA